MDSRRTEMSPIEAKQLVLQAAQASENLRREAEVYREIMLPRVQEESEGQHRALFEAWVAALVVRTLEFEGFGDLYSIAMGLQEKLHSGE